MARNPPLRIARMPMAGRRDLCLLAGAAALLPAAVAGANASGSAPGFATASRFFTATDGTRLHYLLAGPAGARTVVLVPGWTMPAWIFAAQIAAFAGSYRVAALDPRAQGESEIAKTGYDHLRRAADIGDFIRHLGGPPVVLLAWSLAVLEALALVHTQGQAALAGLVLVDNSIGEDQPPVAPPPRRGPKPPHAQAMRAFVGGMFRRPQPAAWLRRLEQATLRVPEPITRQLLAYPVPRAYWKAAAYEVDRPLLYIVRPKFAGQARNLAARHPTAEIVTLGDDVGHALFVDDPGRFNTMVLDFIRRRVWPA